MEDLQIQPNAGYESVNGAADPAVTENILQQSADVTENTKTPYIDRVVIATRDIKTYRLEIVEGAIVVRTIGTTYSLPAVWHQDVIEQAMFYNMSEYVNAVSKSQVITVHPEELTLEDTDFISELTEFHPLHEIISKVVFNTKSKKGLPRIDKVRSLLKQFGITNGQFISAGMRLRSLREASPLPHVETNEMTLGSTTEIQAQNRTVEALSVEMESTIEKINKHIDAINSEMPKEDSGWAIPFPEVVSEIMQYNPPYDFDMPE